jgi:hypothetical protein
MSYLRGQARQVIQTINDYLVTQLTELGWMSTPDELPFGATTPVTIIDYVPAATGAAVAPNTVGFTSGDETDDEDDELGAASGGLFKTDYVLFFDIYGESQGIALALAADIKGIFTGKFSGTNRYQLVTDYTQSPPTAAPGHLLEFRIVERTRPQTQEFKKNWQVIKVTAEHTYNAVEF